MPYAHDDGVELWYDVNGNGTGEPLVLSGGFGLLQDQFAKIRDLLTPHLQVIDWNYRGAGQSDRSWPGRDHSLVDAHHAMVGVYDWMALLVKSEPLQEAREAEHVLVAVKSRELDLFVVDSIFLRKSCVRGRERSVHFEYVPD